MTLPQGAEHCAVPGCDRSQHARGYCAMHYQRGNDRGSFDLAVVGAPPRDSERPVICVCALPRPDGIGECQGCYRPVVTFMSVDDAAQVWPVEYQHALRLGLVPRSMRAAS